MGARLTTFENRSSVEMEIRFFKPPARPDHFRRIIRIKPGRKEDISLTDLCCYNDTNPERPAIIMIFAEGVYAGVSLVPFDLLKYSKVICDRSDNGLVSIRGVRTRLIDFRRPNLNWSQRGCGFLSRKELLA